MLSANWDDCIERSGTVLGGEIEPTVTDEDRRNGRWANRLHKVHGCARHPDSLLVSAEELADPPDWVRQGVCANLGADSLVFVGLSTVADYVGTRIRQLLVLGSEHLDDIAVVMPESELPTSWTALLPDEEAYLVSMTADEFLDELLRAIAAEAIARAQEELGRLTLDLDPGRLAAWQDGLDRLLAQLGRMDALGVLRWWTDGAAQRDVTGTAGAQRDVTGTAGAQRDVTGTAGAQRDVTGTAGAQLLLAVAAIAGVEVRAARHDRLASVDAGTSYVELARASGGSGEGSGGARKPAWRRGAYPRRDKPVLVVYEGSTGTPVPACARDVTNIDPDRLSVVDSADGPEVRFRPVAEILHEMAA